MTMNATAPAAPAATPAPSGSTPSTTAKPADATVAQTAPKDAAPIEKTRVRAHDRAVKARARLESPSESAAEDAATSPPDAGPSAADSGGDKPKAEPAKVDDERAKHIADRARRLANVRATEAAKEEGRQQKRQDRDKDGVIEKLRKDLAEREPDVAVWKSPSALLARAEKEGMTATDLITEMRTQLADPQAIAKREAQTVEGTLRAEMKAMQARLDKAEADRVAEKAEAEAQRESVSRAQAFHKQVTDKAESHPLTASLMKRRGANALVQFANEQVVPYLSEGFDLETLHDVTEQYLEWIHGGGESPAHAATAGESHPPKKSGADQPVTTLSNRLGSERVTVTEEIPLHKMSRRDREERLRRQLERE